MAQNKITTKSLVNRIFLFSQEYSGISFYKYQQQFAKRIIRSVLENDGEEITALFSRQSGKSETIAVVTGALCVILPLLANMPMFADDARLQPFKNGIWIGIFAPTLNQSQITYNRIRTRLGSKRSEMILNELGITKDTNNGVTVALSNGSYVTSRSASEGSNIEGDTYHFIIIEECQDVSNYKIRKSIHPMGASTNATIAKIGTCTTYRGDFYDAIQRNKKDYSEGKKCKNHFEYNYEVVMKYNPKYEKYIKKEIYRLGIDSDEFRLSYKLEWILERSMFVTMKILNDKVYNKTLAIVEKDLSRKHVVGIDFGKIKDSTIITVGEPDWDNPVILERPKNIDTASLMSNQEAYVAYNVKVKNWLELLGDDYETQYFEIMSFLSNYNIVRMCVDSTGTGAPIADRLIANMRCEVIPYVYTTPSKSMLYKHLNAEIRGGRLIIPADDEVQETLMWRRFEKQMLELQKSYSGTNMVVSHPSEKGAHDDYPDSLSLMVWAAKGEGLHKIEVQDNNPLYSKKQYVKRAVSVAIQRNRSTARRRA